MVLLVKVLVVNKVEHILHLGLPQALLPGEVYAGDDKSALTSRSFKVSWTSESYDGRSWIGLVVFLSNNFQWREGWMVGNYKGCSGVVCIPLTY